MLLSDQGSCPGENLAADDEQEVMTPRACKVDRLHGTGIATLYNSYS